MKICKIKDCKNKVKAKGWCSKHYMRWRRYGDPNVVKIDLHGYSKHPLYKIWQSMKDRCYNENDKGYKNYGDRGITVCVEWKNNPRVFIEWALPLWKKGLLIDRIDNDGNYCPENCQFITHAESNRNKRLLQSNNTSGYRGVYFKKNNRKWVAQIGISGKRKHLGYFNSAREAALVYDSAAIDNKSKNLF